MLDHLVQGGEAAAKLLSLIQGAALVADYSVQFRKLTTDSGWNAALGKSTIRG